jgi:divalent metal cation (Fe/Co/Zn/Cd) transporter
VDPRRFAATTSLVVASLVFALKLVAWGLTGSSAVLSDALESIVNVAAAAFLLFAARFAADPPDGKRGSQPPYCGS